MSTANPHSDPLPRWPDLVAHCDWGSQPSKRWIALATRKSGQYTAYPPQLVGEMETLLPRLRKMVPAGSSILVGFDFPLGLPSAYAQRAQIPSFPAFLQEIHTAQSGSSASRWSHFHQVCAEEHEIALERPFYPLRPGHARRDLLHAALGLEHRNQLYRLCELRHAERTNACSLFWTLGGNQVGKSALLGWRHVLAPQLAQQPHSTRLWPFHGSLAALLQPGMLVATETYPTEYHHRLFGRSLRGKRYAANRRAIAPAWLAAAHRHAIRIDHKLRRQILSGFTESCLVGAVVGPQRADNHDDAMDAAIGLFGMLLTLQDYGPQLEPDDTGIRAVEGWIFGLQHPLPTLLPNSLSGTLSGSAH